MKVSTIQFRVDADEGKQASIQRMGKCLDACAGSNLIVLPELWATGYYAFDKYQEQSETAHGETVQFLCDKAKKLGAYIAGGSYIEQEKGRYYNSMPFISPKGELLASYRKIHLVSFDSKEVEIFTPGDKCVAVETEFGVIGLTICYDLRFPELYRAQLDNNVDFMINSAAWAFPRIDHWSVLSRSRAIENVCYAIACNAVGTDNGKTYFGHSAIINPWGVAIASAGYDEAIITAEIDREDIINIRKRFPPVNDRCDFKSC